MFSFFELCSAIRWIMFFWEFKLCSEGFWIMFWQCKFELCSANRRRHDSSNYVRLKWTGAFAVGEQRGTLGRENFPLFNMATESISSELCKCVKDLILLVEQRRFGETDLIRFRLDWLCNVVVRYVDHIPSGEVVLNLMHEAAVLFNSHG